MNDEQQNINTLRIGMLTATIRGAAEHGLFEPCVRFCYNQHPDDYQQSFDELFDLNLPLNQRMKAGQQLGFRADLAGWTCAMFAADAVMFAHRFGDMMTPPVDDFDVYVRTQAQEALGLSDTQASHLFRRRFGITPENTVAALIHLADTGEVRWEQDAA